MTNNNLEKNSNNASQTVTVSWQHTKFGPTPSFFRDAFTYFFTAEIAAISILSVPSLLKGTGWENIIDLQAAATFSFLVICLLIFAAALIFISQQNSTNIQPITYTRLDTIGCLLLSAIMFIMLGSFMVLSAFLSLNLRPESIAEWSENGFFDGLMLAILVYGFIKLSSV